MELGAFFFSNLFEDKKINHIAVWPDRPADGDLSLIGMAMTVATPRFDTSSVREPLCARVLHVALGENINVREALRKCGVFDPDSPEIDPGIRAMIENKIDDGDFHFNVVTRV